MESKCKKLLPENCSLIPELYRAFGEQLKRLDDQGQDTDDKAKYSYGGKELDSNTNLYYFNARYYDATIGRFINVDPIQDGSNWYVYAANNPLSVVDPSGLENNKPDQINPIKGGITAEGYHLWQDYDNLYDAASTNEGDERHKGYDFTSSSKEVVATAAGKIVFLGKSPAMEKNENGDKEKQGVGYMIIIDYGGGYYGLYGHMDESSINELGLEEGVTVEQGQDLGKYTNIGNSSGAHLHYQLNKIPESTEFTTKSDLILPAFRK